MKNEKFCFSKGTGLIALVGIVLIVLVLFSTVINKPTSTNTRAANGKCHANYVINGRPIILENGACEQVQSGKTSNGKYLLVNSGYKCINPVDSFITLPHTKKFEDLSRCPLACIYGETNISLSEVPKTLSKSSGTTYYLTQNHPDYPYKRCIAERKAEDVGVIGNLIGKSCDFKTRAVYGGVPSAKVSNDKNCVVGAQANHQNLDISALDKNKFLSNYCSVSLYGGEDLGIISQYKDSSADRSYAVGAKYVYFDMNSKDHQSEKYNEKQVNVLVATVSTPIEEGDSAKTIMGKIAIKKKHKGCYQPEASKWLIVKNGDIYGLYSYSTEYVACMNNVTDSTYCSTGIGGKVKFGEQVYKGEETTDETLFCGCRRVAEKNGKLLPYPVIDKRMNLGIGKN